VNRIEPNYLASGGVLFSEQLMRRLEITGLTKCDGDSMYSVVRACEG